MNTGSYSKTYVIKYDPVPLARIRFAQGHAYDSQKHLKMIWGIALRNLHGDAPLFTGPLLLDITFFMPRAKSTLNKKSSKNKYYHVYKPDLDNMIKWVCDISNEILFNDDCIISVINSRKIYSEDVSRTEFTLRELNETEKA